MRVVAGELRGRRLVTPPGATTRPTSDKVRQATFNALESSGDVEDAAVLDLFAGSGALGIEALSRGAAHATFVERDRGALAALRANLDALGLSGRSTVVVGDALQHTAGRWDLVLLDPPYAFDGWARLLAGIEAGVVVCESGAPIDAPPGWRLAREKRYGSTVVSIFRQIEGHDG